MSQNLKYSIYKHNRDVPKHQFRKISGKIALFVSRIVLLGLVVFSFFFFPSFLGGPGYIASVATLVSVWIFLLRSEKHHEVDLKDLDYSQFRRRKRR